MTSSVLLPFELPGHATWFVLSLLVAVGIFYQFSRPLAVRNFDLLGLFLFAPGLLILDESHRSTVQGDSVRGRHFQVLGYVLLLGACFFALVRGFVDLAKQKRARISPNLTLGGLHWLGGTLLLGLSIASLYGSSSRPGTTISMAGSYDMAAGGSVAMALTESRARSVGIMGMGAVSQLAVVILLHQICRRHFQDAPAGAGSSLLYLMLPSTVYHFGQSNHVWPTALVLGAVFAYRRAAWAGGILGVAAGTAFFPLFLFPFWMQFYRDRGGISFARWFGLTAGVSFVATCTVLATLGDWTTGVWQTPHLADWQPWRVPTAPSVWTGAHWAYRLPVFVAFLGLVLTGFIWPVVRNLGQLIAMTAVVFVGMQFWLADGGGVYVSWFSPLMLLLAFRPTTLDIEPPMSLTVKPESVANRWLGRQSPSSKSLPAYSPGKPAA